MLDYLLSMPNAAGGPEVHKSFKSSCRLIKQKLVFVMKISIVGAGYVGLSTGVGFVMRGNDVICVDIDRKKVDCINAGIPPIYEPGMEAGLKDAIQKRKISATADINDAVARTELTFISVPTPQNEDGSSDLRFMRKASEDVGSALKGKKGYHVVVVKSTVLPGTTESVVIPALEERSGKRAGPDFGVCMNPEFLREGRALEDFLKPDRIVIGSQDTKAGDTIEGLYCNFGKPMLRVEIKTAEMIKYAANALLATKISFSNEIGNLCKNMGIDVYDVMKGVGMDSRLSPHFLEAGAGFGGSCFPKDVAAMVAKARESGHDSPILSSVLGVNKSQRSRIVDMLESRQGSLNGKMVAVLGLAFKPDSDDIREAPAIDVISMLLGRGADVSAYDPKAMENMKAVHPKIKYCGSAAECLKAADACVILTDWDEFKGLSDRDFAAMKGSTILECRKVLSPERVKRFEGICWPGAKQAVNMPNGFAGRKRKVAA